MGKNLQFGTVNNSQVKSQDRRKISNITTNKNWQKEIVLGNDAMAKKLFFSAYNHYKIALTIAKKILVLHQNAHKIPDSVVPAVVVSYLNICELCRKQNNVAARKVYLYAAFDYLVAQFQTPTSCTRLKEQLRRGLDKIYIEIIAIANHDDLAIKKKTLMDLR